MKFKNLAKVTLLILTAAQVNAGDIAHGTIKAIKVYDFPTNKTTKIYFDNNSTHKDEVECEGVAVITHSLHDPDATQKMLSIALSAYMAGKKVRAYSTANGSCEVELISLQEKYF